MDVTLNTEPFSAPDVFARGVYLMFGWKAVGGEVLDWTRYWRILA